MTLDDEARERILRRDDDEPNRLAHRRIYCAVCKRHVLFDGNGHCPDRGDGRHREEEDP